MQCNQPLFCTGFQNTQIPPYLTQPYYPDVIGEGDVLTYTLPDGSVQCYFVPVNRRERWIPQFASSYYMPSYLPNNKETWFVRSILNTYPGAGLNQLPNNCGEAFLQPTVNSPSFGFVQKFHNDGWTSTTDLHYFFPSLRHDWARGCAGIQVEIPNAEKTIFHYGTVCNRPCHCNRKEVTNTASGGAETPMCVDEVKSAHSCCSDSGKKKKRSKNKNPSCFCRRVETADKVVTTYADQANSCCDTSRSQSRNRKVLERSDIETEEWYPRRRRCKKHARCSHAAATSDCACSDSEQFNV